jgi:hypothetical protein
MNDLPEFKATSTAKTWHFVRSVFGVNALAIEENADHHFRVIFKSTQFHIHEGHDSPTKSQWSSLKKRMKRHDTNVFVFKETGKADCPDEQSEDDCYYVDFGFFVD